MKRVVIIGAGLGGLAAALRLSHSGFNVTLLEKNERVGGKMSIIQKNGYTFDTGPSLLTMPFVLRELFESIGRRLEDELDLVPAEPICRYVFSDGSRLDASSDVKKFSSTLAAFSPNDLEGFSEFLAHGKKIYEAASGPFLFQPFSSLTAAGILRNMRLLPSVVKIDAFRTLNACVESFVQDPRLRQLLNRFATYNGSSPYAAPATLALIPYIEFTFGGWYIKEGMYRLATVLERLAKEAGVQVKSQTLVERIEVKRGAVAGVRCAGGEELEADIIVSNADALYAHEQLLSHTEARATWGHVEPSLGGYVLLLGVRKKFPALSHHNIFFSADYRAEFRTMFNEFRPASDPTVYLCNTSASDPQHAPHGSSNLFVLVNAPPLHRVGAHGASRYVFDWVREERAYRTLVLKKLAGHNVNIDERDIEVEEAITPLDFEKRFNAYRGSIYGTSSNSRMAAFVRPPNASRTITGLYFVGGSSHPGGGIPLVLLSGKIVSEMICSDVAVLQR